VLTYKGAVYAINADASGDTNKYIYWDKGNNPTTFQTTNTLSEAMGQHKWIMCVNDNGVARPVHAGKPYWGEMLTVETLGAITAQLGNVFAGTLTGTVITGGTIRTATSGKRVEMDEDGIKLLYGGSAGRIGTSANGGSNIVIGESVVKAIADDTLWTSPTGHSDPDSGWSNEENAYDESTVSHAATSYIAPETWTKCLWLTHAALDCDKVRFYLETDSEYIDVIYVEVYYEGGWHDVYQGEFEEREWIEKSIPAGQKSVTAMRISFYNSDTEEEDIAFIIEADFGLTIPGITKASNAKVSCASHGFSVGNKVKFESVGGMTEINYDTYGDYGVITDADPDSDGNAFEVDIDSTGFTTYTSGGTATVGSGEVVGAGYLATINNPDKAVPFRIESEQTVADFHYFNRNNTPSGAAEVGDTCVVQGIHYICTVAGTPGTWTKTGVQT